MLATAQNMHHNPVQGSKVEAGTKAPAKPEKELKRYHVRLHFPELKVGRTVIPAGIKVKGIWATSPLDACIHMSDMWKVAIWAEVVRWYPVTVYFPASWGSPAFIHEDEILGSSREDAYANAVWNWSKAERVEVIG